MKTAIGDADWLLLNVAQGNYSRAKREQEYCVDLVAHKLDCSKAEAKQRMETGLLTERLNGEGIEVYEQRACQSAWPDTQTWAVWALMAIGYATVFCIV